jgi:hypothetical protein
VTDHDQKCTCGSPQDPNCEGPEQDCPEHGDVRWYAHLLSEANTELQRQKAGRAIEQQAIRNMLPTLAANDDAIERLTAEGARLKVALSQMDNEVLVHTSNTLAALGAMHRAEDIITLRDATIQRLTAETARATP